MEQPLNKQKMRSVLTQMMEMWLDHQTYPVDDGYYKVNMTVKIDNKESTMEAFNVIIKKTTGVVN